MTIKEKALRFWADKTKNNEYVILTNDISDQRQKEYLVKAKYISSVTRGYWILKRPEDDLEEVFSLLYWQLIEKILARYESSIRSNSALLIYNGAQETQKHLLVRTKEKTNRKVTMPLGYDIILTYDSDFDERLVKKITVAGRELPIDIPEKVLIDIGRQKPDNNFFQSFVAGTKFDLRILEVLYADNPKPIVFKRLVGLVKEVNRLDLVPVLEKIIETHTHYRVGKKERIEQEATEDKIVILKPPWVIRQEQQIQEFEEVLDKKIIKDIESLEKYPISKLLKQAKEHKKYDTYHSTTLEGYQITLEEVEALLSGDIPRDKEAQGDNVEKIKNRMAIIGYSAAFDFVIKRAQVDFNKVYINEKIVQDTYYHLFKPSADAGIVDYLTLTSYRNIPAYIRGTPYVPPSYEKLPELMASFESIINRVENPIIKAILAHYLFVTIHPYIDGNGRTARLLMNYLLLASGYSWITIRAEQRIEYFTALQKAQAKNDILPFGRFIVEMLENVTKVSNISAE